MSKKEVEEFAKGYTSVKFDITKLEAHKPEGLWAIIKFDELKDAVDFVEAVRASNSWKSVVEKIGYAPNESISSALYPAFLLVFMLFPI